MVAMPGEATATAVVTVVQREIGDRQDIKSIG